MKVLFVNAERNLIRNPDSLNLSILPEKICLCYSLQYKSLAQQIRKILGKRAVCFRQILGCTSLVSKYPILLVGSGRFHALQLALQGNNKVYIMEGESIVKLNEKEIETFKLKKKTALARFFSAESIGILVSCKPGQENLNKAVKFKSIIKKKNKSPYIFLADTINTSEFENFKIESWVNTSCPGLILNNASVINLSDINLLA